VGIRFYCPSGHKLNVKSFQAGKTGICPHCGAKLIVPTRSTRPSSDEMKNQPLESDNIEAEVSEVSVPTDLPVEDVTEDRESKFEPPSIEILAGQHLDLASATDTPSDLDPLSETPDAVWYVRLTSGEQFGPASRDMMAEWLAEDRIAPDSLIWREGWVDWRKASEVFEQLSDEDLSIKLALIPTTPISRTTSRHRTSRRDNTKKNIAIIKILLLVLAILACILGWVLS